ncbi:MAG TPA: ABC transporter permease [Stellaceae bacterium]|nr:ABC transporter permease [Stellaceae bacterium]
MTDLAIHDPVAASEPLPQAARSVWSLRWRRLRANRVAMGGLVLLIILMIFSFSAPLVGWALGVDPNHTDLLARFDGASAEHWLGTDDAGRDVMLRLMVGGRISLLVGFTGALSSALVGTVIGLVAGYYRGRIDSVLMRVTDGVIALPLLPLLIVFAAIDLKKLGFSDAFMRSGDANFYRIVVIITLVQWTTVARLVRAATLSLLSREYVLAAQAQGASARHILLTHILPNAVSPIIVATTLAVGQIILFESVLSFLGLGILPPTPSWGNMLNNAQELVTAAPVLAFYPGALIFATVIAVNFFGDGLQNAFDPRSGTE